MAKQVIKHRLLFHATHGLCRVKGVSEETETQEACYTLVPIPIKISKMRFNIPVDSLEASGFNPLVSTQEAHAILDYFHSGRKLISKNDEAWRLARLIRVESCNKMAMRDGRRRQAVLHALRGLVGELAYVLEMTQREIADILRKDLAALEHISPTVLSALVKIDQNNFITQ